MLQRVVADCDSKQVTLLIAGLDRLAASEPAKLSAQLTAMRFEKVREAIEHVEEALLYVEGEIVGDHVLSAEIHDVLGLDGLQDYVAQVSVTAGDIVIAQGSKTEEIYFLTAGELLVFVTQADGTSRAVAKIMAGSLIGEFAHYSGRMRSANIVAHGAAQLVRVDMRRLSDASPQDLSAAVALHKLIARHMARRLTQTTALLRELGY